MWTLFNGPSLTSAEMLKCEHCKVPDFLVVDSSNGVYVCTECGLVASDMIDEDSFYDNSTGHMSHETCGSFQLTMRKLMLSLYIFPSSG